jgi:hypothetical protein
MDIWPRCAVKNSFSVVLNSLTEGYGLVCGVMHVFLVRYLTTLSVSKLYSVDDRMINEYEADGWMKTGRGNQSNRRKPAPVPLSAPQIPHDLTLDRTRSEAGD